MTTHDRDKVIAAAKESGMVSLDYSYFLADENEWKEISSFYAIAFEDGRQAEREDCARILEKQDVDPSFKHRMAEAIRAMGESK